MTSPIKQNTEALPIYLVDETGAAFTPENPMPTSATLNGTVSIAVNWVELP